MSGVPPLRDIHKKGVFGNHHKQEESNLLKISANSKLKIFQIVQYKKSKIEPKGIDGLKLPTTSLTVNSNSDLTYDQTRVMWSGPRTWILTSSKPNIIDMVKESFNKEDFAVTDLSQSRSVIEIKGKNAKEVLKKGCPLNFDDFKKNNCAGSVFHGITILIDMVEDDPDTFNLFCLRSFSESFYHAITDSALEDGYIGA